MLSLPLIGFALAAIFPATIWLMPQRVPATVVPAAVGFMTLLVWGSHYPNCSWLERCSCRLGSIPALMVSGPDGGSASLASATCTHNN